MVLFESERSKEDLGLPEQVLVAESAKVPSGHSETQDDPLRKVLEHDVQLVAAVSQVAHPSHAVQTFELLKKPGGHKESHVALLRRTFPDGQDVQVVPDVEHSLQFGLHVVQFPEALKTLSLPEKTSA